MLCDVNEWLAANQTLINEYHHKHYPSLAPDILTYTEGGKFFKIIRISPGQTSGSVHAFIANQDFINKGLGVVVKGQIFKPASATSPAKWARGSIYDASKGMSCMGPCGPAYLK